MTEQDGGVLYIPDNGSLNVSVWVTDRELRLFTNIAEETAANLAEHEDEHIFFFAELSPPDEGEVRHGEHYRSAVTGQFVTEDEADANPDTTVKEEE